MKRIVFISIISGLLLFSCESSLYKKLPEGTFISNDHRIILESDGSFVLENIGNTNDGHNELFSGDP